MYRLPELGHGPITDAPLKPALTDQLSASLHPTRSRVLDLLQDCPDVEHCRHATVLEQLLFHHDFEYIQAYDVSFSSGDAVLLIVNAEVWREPAEMHRLRALVEDKIERFVVLPKAMFSSSPHIPSCLADRHGLRSTRADRVRLLLHLIERGTSTLFDCACVTTSHAPIPSVLQIAAEGYADLNLDASIGPNTPVSLPARFQ